MIKHVGSIVGIGDGKVLGTNNGLIDDDALGDALCDPLGITLGTTDDTKHSLIDCVLLRASVGAEASLRLSLTDRNNNNKISLTISISSLSNLFCHHSAYCMQ